MGMLSWSAFPVKGDHPSLAPHKECAIPPRFQNAGLPGAVSVRDSVFKHCFLTLIYRNYGLESPRLLKRGMKSRSLCGAWGWVGLAHFSVIRGVVAQDIVGWSHC